jgi:hypothetical protein
VAQRGHREAAFAIHAPVPPMTAHEFVIVLREIRDELTNLTKRIERLEENR